MPRRASRTRERTGLERLLRYCARPPFALERLELLGHDQLVYRLPKPQPDGLTELRLSPLELLERLAARIPPPRLGGCSASVAGGTTRAARGSNASRMRESNPATGRVAPRCPIARLRLAALGIATVRVGRLIRLGALAARTTIVLRTRLALESLRQILRVLRT